MGDTKLTQKLYELFTSRKYDELLDYCSIILSKDHVNLTALKYKAYSLYFLERFEDSIACYDRAIQIEPDSHLTMQASQKHLINWEDLKRLELVTNKQRN